MTTGNNLHAAWTYDATISRLTRTQLGSSAPTSGGISDHLDRGYGYDNVGNLTQLANNHLGETQQFAYDEHDWLTSAQTTGSAASYNDSYAYDAVGNFTTKGGVELPRFSGSSEELVNNGITKQDC